MAKFIATVERAGGGSWTAALFAEQNVVLGTGATKDEALEDLRKGIAEYIGYLKGLGESFPESSIELVSIEVAM